VNNETTEISSDAPNAGLRCMVMVCTYNERDNLPSLVEAICKNVPQADVLVVDDNSPDGTGKWAEAERQYNPKLMVITRTGKLGLGSAIRTGLKYGLDQGYDRIVNLDADFSHDPAMITKLISATTRPQSPCDVAIGSRYVEGGKITGLSRLRRWMSRAINTYARLLLGLNVGDWSSSFRAYNSTHLRLLKWDDLQCNGYGSLQELLWKLHKTGAVIEELPIHYVNRRHGKSKISSKEAYGALHTLHRLAVSRWSG
jgi:dolichol-phosphate mannosyltransferase